jgi:hypothetical protein
MENYIKLEKEKVDIDLSTDVVELISMELFAYMSI